MSIPALGLAAELQPAALTGRGELPLPDDPARASWLDSSAAPGERGTAVLAGHVDTAHGPATVYQLSAAAPGTGIDVTRADGITAHFVVDAVAVHPRNHFPDGVYHPTPGPSLRLITCTGWDAKRKTYRDNVVYATLHHTSYSRPAQH